MAKLKLQSNADPLVASQIAVARKKLEGLTSRLQLLNEKMDKLSVLAPQSGKVLPAAIRQVGQADDEQFFPWTGRLTDERNLGCIVQRGDALFSIVDESHKNVTLYVGEREIDYIQQGQAVTMLLSQTPGQLFHGSVLAIYEVDVDVNEDEARDIGVEQVEGPSGKRLTLQTPYRVIVKFEQLPKSAFIGSGGRARIHVPSQTLVQKAVDFMERLASMNL